jgi:hypothetical protein
VSSWRTGGIAEGRERKFADENLICKSVEKSWGKEEQRENRWERFDGAARLFLGFGWEWRVVEGN